MQSYSQLLKGDLQQLLLLFSSAIVFLYIKANAIFSTIDRRTTRTADSMIRVSFVYCETQLYFTL